jgi:membrane-associated phospholipid phosphatase
MTLQCIYKQNRFFFIGYFLLLIFALFILIFYSKADGFFLLNPWHPQWLNWFFIPFTYFGDGLFVIAMAIVLFFLKRKLLALLIFSSYALSGIVAQVLKYFIVEARPAVYLEKFNYPYFIDDVTLHNFHSFPSGHTASAFALAAILSFAVSKKAFGLIFLFLAVMVGYSRIFLGQHFLDDVFAGSLIGVVSSIICELYLSDPFNRLLIKNVRVT